MTMRPRLSAWILGLALNVPPPGMAAQDYQLPDSLARLGLPRDPGEVPRLVAAGNLPVQYLLRVVCPSDGGWAGAVFDALEEAAEADSVVRSELADGMGARVHSKDICLDDLPRFESWLAGELRRQWSDGVLSDEADDSNPEPLFLMSYISLSEDPATRALVRDIATDSTVTDVWRSQAARTLIAQRYGNDLGGRDRASDPLYLEAVRSVLADLESGPPLPEFSSQMEEWLGMLEAEREREEALRVAREEGWARPEIPEQCVRLFVPARMASSDSYFSELMSRHYPEEMKGMGLGGTTKLQLQVDEQGKVDKARVDERSVSGHFDHAALTVARQLRYSPALMCNRPIRDVVTLTLTFFPSRE